MITVPRRLALAAAALALATACGTTVPAGTASGTTGSGLSSTTGSTQPGADASSTPGGSTSDTPSASSNRSSTTGGPSSGGSAPTTSGTSTGDSTEGSASGGTTTGSSGTTSSGRNGPGVTATRIVIGLTYAQSAKSANEAFGASGLEFGDPVAGSRLLVKDINAHGGIAGRQIELLTYAVDPQSTQTYAQLGQQACTYFTQDHKVFAVIDGAAFAEERACLEKHGVLHLGGSLISAPITAHEFDVYGTQISRAFRALPDELSSHGWFTPWNRTTGSAGTTKAKVGIVTADSPADDAAVDHVLIPALRRLGYAPAAADVIRITPPNGFGDDGAVVAAIDNAALKLNADGVDHVLLNDGNGSLSLLFNNYAYSQHYFPRYGGTSGNGWQTLMTAGDLRPDTMRGAMGIGWQPLLDIPFTNGDGPRSTPARHHCFAVFAAAGSPHTDGGTAAGQAEGCDIAYFLPAMARGLTGPLNLSTVTDHINALQSSYPVGSGFTSYFSSAQHDGTGSYSFLSFDSSCSCMAYSGSVKAMPR